MRSTPRTFRVPRFPLPAGTLLALAVAALAQGCQSRSASPLPVAGLREKVTLRRDARAIPYIEAANDHDLFFTQGYVTAGDRLWQMDLLRRTARGELAEILGKEVLEQDALMRTYGFGALADGLVDRLPARTRETLAAYAEGVNAYIGSHAGSQLPAEFRLLGYAPKPWREGDTLVIGKIFAQDLGDSWSLDVMRATFADLPADRRAALFREDSPLDQVLVGGSGPSPGGAKPSASLPFPRDAAPLAGKIRATLLSALRRAGLDAPLGAASNNWVASGARSSTGMPMLANDPHLAPSAPSIWYMTHLSAPGIRVAGVTAPGVAGILIGHNERIAWGVTNLMADVQDLYEERFDDSGRAAAPGGPRPPQRRRERILVRGGAPEAAPGTVEREVVVTRHGPVVLEAGGRRFALRWTALDPDACELAAFLDIDRAADWKEFTAALGGFAGPPLNFVYADTGGHIGYYAAGRIPVRRSGDGTVPVSGADDAAEWSGYVSPDELPHLLDPPSGVIVTANNRVVGPGYPHLITRAWDVPYRAHRIAELLAAKPKLSADDFQAIQADTYSTPDVLFARAVLEMSRERSSGDKEWAAMAKVFGGWDGRAGADSRVLPLAVAMRRAFAKKVLSAVLGKEREQEYHWLNQDTLVDEIVTTRPAAWLPAGYASYPDLLLDCWKEGRADLSARLGADESAWTWGRVGRAVRFPHPLAGLPDGARFLLEPLPKWTGGSSETVNAGMYVSMRLIADVADWDRTRQGIPLGESGDLSDSHGVDQLADWRSGTTRPFPFSAAAVSRAAVETRILAPTEGGTVPAPAAPRKPQ
jgi:penicillin G amidase